MRSAFSPFRVWSSCQTPTAFSIAPGFFPTALSQKLWAQPHMKQWGESVTPQGKLGDVQDLVGAAVFLASPAAAFITGQTIRVDGGITAGINWPIEL